MGIVLATLLATCAYKDSVSSNLPNTSYLTFLDKYNLAIMGGITLQALGYSHISTLSDGSRDQAGDATFFRVLVALFVVGHALVLKKLAAHL